MTRIGRSMLARLSLSGLAEPDVLKGIGGRTGRWKPDAVWNLCLWMRAIHLRPITADQTHFSHQAAIRTPISGRVPGNFISCGMALKSLFVRSLPVNVLRPCRPPNALWRRNCDAQ